jgi:hypothetical protein
MTNIFAQDIALDASGQAKVAANGELILTTGPETGVQDIRLRLGQWQPDHCREQPCEKPDQRGYKRLVPNFRHVCLILGHKKNLELIASSLRAFSPDSQLSCTFIPSHFLIGWVVFAPWSCGVPINEQEVKASGLKMIPWHISIALSQGARLLFIIPLPYGLTHLELHVIVKCPGVIEGFFQSAVVTNLAHVFLPQVSFND